MPKRTNLFQQVVEILHRHMAGEATVESSAMLPIRSTGGESEVDVVIRAKQAGHEIIVSVEAVDRSRKADRTWVYAMVAKHDDLPTSKLVLVSQKGFTKEARALALANNAVPVAPEDLPSENPENALIRAVPALWPKLFVFKPEKFIIDFTDADVPEDGWTPDRTATLVVQDDAEGCLVGELRKTLRLMWDLPGQSDGVIEQIDLVNRMEDAEEEFAFVFFPVQGDELQIPIDGVWKPLYLLNENGRGYTLRAITAVGTVTIKVSKKIPLSHTGRLGELKLNFAYGEGNVAGRDALVVVSEGDDSTGQGQLTMLFRPPDASKAA